MCFRKKTENKPVQEEIKKENSKEFDVEELHEALFSVDMVPIAPPKDLGKMAPEVSPEEFTIYRKN